MQCLSSPVVCRHQTPCLRTWTNLGIKTSKLPNPNYFNWMQTCNGVQCSPPVCQHQTACQETWKNWVIAWKNWGIATHITSKLLRMQTTDIESRPMQCSPSVCKNQTACQWTWKNQGIATHATKKAFNNTKPLQSNPNPCNALHQPANIKLLAKDLKEWEDCNPCN